VVSGMPHKCGVFCKTKSFIKVRLNQPIFLKNLKLKNPKNLGFFVFGFSNLPCQFKRTLASNFVPARRDSDSAVGMYETVSGTFFASSAPSSPFTAGPALGPNLYLPSRN
jgi:hypothetical protein